MIFSRLRKQPTAPAAPAAETAPESRIRALLREIPSPDKTAAATAADMIADIMARDSRILVSLGVEPEHAEQMESLRLACENLLRKQGGFPADAKVDVILTHHRAAAVAPPAPSPAKPPPAPPSQGKGRHHSGQKVSLPNVGTLIAVASGKGGVGKSTVAVNLALALSALGKRVGILDGDIHGPSLPRMLGLEGKPESDDGKRILPKEKHGLRCMSIGLMTPPDAALVWRGPMIQSALMQLLGDVAWGELDVLLVDMPPGTGDIPLSLAQLAPLRGVVAVSTPQEVALGDVRRALNMFRRAEVAVLGVVENMACFVAPESGAKHYIFGKGGARRLAEEMELPFLGEIPLMERICEGGDSGLPVLLDAESAEAGPFMEVGRNLLAHLEAGEGEAPARP